MRRLAGFLEVIKVIAIVFVTAVIIRYFVFQPFQVEGSSMEPNYHTGEFLLIEKFSYRFKEPQRGDVIVFRYPNQPRIDYIKRIIGLPGETIRIENGKVQINGQPLAETYLPADTQTIVSGQVDLPYETTLGEDNYFVMGDNRSRSSDSREWGPLDKSFIIGRSSLVLYPNDFQAVASPR